MRGCPVTKCNHNIDGFCTEGSCENYVLYRDVTGICETCGAKLANHPKCDACNILCGEGHLDEPPSLYRGHNLCGHCIVKWETLDKVIGREANWQEVVNPRPKIFWERAIGQEKPIVVERAMGEEN